MEVSYEQLVAWLDALIDQIGQDENHPLAQLMQDIGTRIENYENENVPELIGEQSSTERSP